LGFAVRIHHQPGGAMAGHHPHLPASAGTGTAPEHPGEFWEQPELRAASRERHYGRLLRAYRVLQDPPLQQAQLAGWLGITQSQLSRIERAITPVHDLAKLDRWSRLLHVPAHLLWFELSSDHPATPSPRAILDEPNQDEPEQGEGDDVRRRELLLKARSAAAIAGGALLLADTPWQRLMHSVDQGRPVDAATIQLLQDRTAELHDTEHSVPPREVLDSLMTHRATLTTLVDNAQTDATRIPLIVMIGETESLLACLHVDLGRANEATNALRAALTAAKQTGDRALAARALGIWGSLADTRNDVGPAVRLFQQAEDHVPGNSAPATRSWIAARAAEELSRSGDETAALRALERAFIAFDFARPRTERAWTGCFTANRLASLTVSTYSILNHPGTTAAADFLLTSLSPTNNKARAIALTELSIVAVRTRDFDRAHALIDSAIDATVRTGTGIAKQRLFTLASTLTTSGAPGTLRDRILSGLRR
ncbi:MAG TPA: helix-turn-helix transcriptional regulator, partial [Pseudonocardiaceae bacterium]|nr:helix-turn-helix transcriptional regulator [Pseudonocardiaceae bacterium]